MIPSLDNGDDDLGGAAGGGCMAVTTGGIQAQLLAIQSSNAQICCELQEVQTNQMADRISISKNFTLVHANIRRIAVQPGVRSIRGTLAGAMMTLIYELLLQQTNRLQSHDCNQV